MDRMHLLSTALLAMTAVGCTLPHVSGRPFAFDGTIHVMSVDPTFSAEEQSEIVAAAELWQRETGGRFSLRVSLEAHGEFAVRRGATGNGVYGRFSRTERAIWVDADGMYRVGFDAHTGVYAMTANMLGLFAGMHTHDGCGVLGRECVEPTFSDADRNACRAIGACL